MPADQPYENVINQLQKILALPIYSEQQFVQIMLGKLPDKNASTEQAKKLQQTALGFILRQDAKKAKLLAFVNEKKDLITASLENQYTVNNFTKILKTNGCTEELHTKSTDKNDISYELILAQCKSFLIVAAFNDLNKKLVEEAEHQDGIASNAIYLVAAVTSSFADQKIYQRLKTLNVGLKYIKDKCNKITRRYSTDEQSKQAINKHKVALMTTTVEYTTQMITNPQDDNARKDYLTEIKQSEATCLDEIDKSNPNWHAVRLTLKGLTNFLTIFCFAGIPNMIKRVATGQWFFFNDERKFAIEKLDRALPLHQEEEGINQGPTSSL